MRGPRQNQGIFLLLPLQRSDQNSQLPSLLAVNNLEGRPADLAADVHEHPCGQALCKAIYILVSFILTVVPRVKCYTCPHSSTEETVVPRSKVTCPTSHWGGYQNASPRHSDTGIGWRQEASKRAATLHYDTLRHRAATCLTSHGWGPDVICGSPPSRPSGRDDAMVVVMMMMTIIIMNDNSHCYNDKASVTCQNQCFWHYLTSSLWQPDEVGVIINRPLAVGVKGLKSPP